MNIRVVTGVVFCLLSLVASYTYSQLLEISFKQEILAYCDTKPLFDLKVKINNSPSLVSSLFQLSEQERFGWQIQSTGLLMDDSPSLIGDSPSLDVDTFLLNLKSVKEVFEYLARVLKGHPIPTSPAGILIESESTSAKRVHGETFGLDAITPFQGQLLGCNLPPNIQDDTIKINLHLPEGRLFHVPHALAVLPPLDIYSNTGSDILHEVMHAFGLSLTLSARQVYRGKYLNDYFYTYSFPNLEKECVFFEIAMELLGENPSSFVTDEFRRWKDDRRAMKRSFDYRVDSATYPSLFAEFQEIHKRKNNNRYIEVVIGSSSGELYIRSRCGAPTKFCSYLVDSFGNKYRPGMKIERARQLSEVRKDVFTIFGGPEAPVYFQGPHVMEALGRGTIFSKDCDGIIYPPGRLPPFEYKYSSNPNRILGLPILAFEYGDADFSHIDLTNFLMSHDLFRNYGILTEVELAVLQDLGYKIDRRNFYGFSIYGDRGRYSLYREHSFYGRVSSNQPVPYRYEVGTPNNTPLTVGLHVYGSGNRIQMCSEFEILQSGRGSVGARIDGLQNYLIIGPGARILCLGENGTGLMVCCGKGHYIEHIGTIVANGGIGARFDFGGSITTLDSDIDMHSFYKDGDEYEESVRGPLVKSFDILGRLEGEQAIFISSSAYVERVEIKNGAEIKGDIVSEWNPRALFARVQNEDTLNFNPDTLHTKICFRGNGCFRGNIKDKGDTLEVGLLGGSILNWDSTGDVAEMTELAKFEMRRGSILCLSESSQFRIAAKKLLFEQGTTILVPAKKHFKFDIEIPEDKNTNVVDDIIRKVKFSVYGSDEVFVPGLEVEEPNELHPQSTILKFFKPLIDVE
jgi:hypothetical protein